MADKTFYREGLHRVRVIGQELGENNNGNTTFVLKILILAEYAQGELQDFAHHDQKERSFRRVITDNTINYFIDDLKALGANITSFKQLDPAVGGFHDFKGMELDMWCGRNDYKGDTYEQWQLPLGDSAPMKKVDPAKLRALDNQFGAALRGAFGAAQSKPAPQPVGAGITDDDVPF